MNLIRKKPVAAVIRERAGSGIALGIAVALAAVAFVYATQAKYRADADFLIVETQSEGKDFYTLFKSSEYLGNVLANPAVALLFVDFDRPQRLRVNGTAHIQLDDPLLECFAGAQLVVRVRAGRIFPNCPRYIHRMWLIEESPYIPRAGIAPPVPAYCCAIVSIAIRQSALPAATPVFEAFPQAA